MKLMLSALVLVVCVAAACERRTALGPPELHLGRDQCSECGMIIHEERSAAALLVNRDGRREHLLFDDIGCMLDSERSAAAGLTIKGRYVHDHGGGGWISGDSSLYLVTDGSTLRTPMASGMAAFADETGAGAAKQRFGGEVVDYATLLARSREESGAQHTGRGR